MFVLCVFVVFAEGIAYGIDDAYAGIVVVVKVKRDCCLLENLY